MYCLHIGHWLTEVGVALSPKHKHATGTSDTYGVKALKPCSVHHRHMLSVTLSFVTRNLLVPEIVREHGEGQELLHPPSPYQLSEMW